MKLETGTAILAVFGTQNVALANALHNGGVPWFVNERGQAVGILNDYPPGRLTEIDAQRERAGQPPLGLAKMAHADAVKTAFRHRIPGVVTYQFQPSELLDGIKAGYDAQSAAIAAGKSVPLKVDPWDYGAICCQYAKGRKEFLGDDRSGLQPLWIQVPPFATKADMQTGSRDLGHGQQERYGQGSFERTEVHV